MYAMVATRHTKKTPCQMLNLCLFGFCLVVNRFITNTAEKRALTRIRKSKPVGFAQYFDFNVSTCVVAPMVWVVWNGVS